MTIIGYARVSTTEQDLSIQEAALRAAGCEVIRAEKRSGTTTQGREQLQTVLEFLRKGDVLMVTRIDRLARSIGDLQDIVRAIRSRGAALKATEQPIDTSTAAGKCFLDRLGVFAEFETNLRRERQLEGIAKAKAAGERFVCQIAGYHPQPTHRSVFGVCGRIGPPRAPVRCSLTGPCIGDPTARTRRGFWAGQYFHFCLKRCANHRSASSSGPARDRNLK